MESVTGCGNNWTLPYHALSSFCNHKVSARFPKTCFSSSHNLHAQQSQAVKWALLIFKHWNSCYLSFSLFWHKIPLQNLSYLFSHTLHVFQLVCTATVLLLQAALTCRSRCTPDSSFPTTARSCSRAAPACWCIPVFSHTMQASQIGQVFSCSTPEPVKSVFEIFWSDFLLRLGLGELDCKVHLVQFHLKSY